MFKKVKVCLLLLVLVAPLFITGCLTSGLGPQFTQAIAPPSGKAVIYVYRQRGVMTAQEMPGVKVNDVEVVDILPEISYFSLTVEPGQYTFTPKLFAIFKTTEAVIDAQAGGVYYVRLKVSIGHLGFAHMNDDEAMAYMATCYELDPKYYLDPRVTSNPQASRSGKASAASTNVPESVAKAVPVQTKNKIEGPSKPVAKSDTRGSLYVEANPSNARIRIMNIAPVFNQGIMLNAGRYDVEVSAPGYVTHREWTSLERGEEKHMRVILASEQKQVPVSSPAKQAVQVQKEVAPVRTVENINVPPDASSEEMRYGDMLQNGSLNEIRNVAKNIYYRYYSSDYLTGLAEQALLEKYSNNPTKLQIDAMAWLCKALGRTGDPRFSETLRTVAQDAPHQKLRRHAEKSLEQL